MRYVSDLKPLDESQWLGFEEKLVGNFLGIAGDPDPSNNDRIKITKKKKKKTLYK
jgi:hypothetical protein